MHKHEAVQVELSLKKKMEYIIKNPLDNSF